GGDGVGDAVGAVADLDVAGVGGGGHRTSLDSSEDHVADVGARPHRSGSGQPDVPGVGGDVDVPAAQVGGGDVAAVGGDAERAGQGAEADVSGVGLDPGGQGARHLDPVVDRADVDADGDPVGAGVAQHQGAALVAVGRGRLALLAPRQ